MSARLLFHVGDFKTGTTAIQHWLAAHGAEHGLYVPDVDVAALANGLSDPGRTASEFRGLARLLRRVRAPCVVLSSEHFEHVAPRDLKRAIDSYLPRWAERVEVLAYVRSHGTALLARYGESVKIGNFTGDPAAYLEWAPTRWRLNTHRRFSRWREVFGDAFDLRFYDCGAFPGGDVVRDFALAVTGRDPVPSSGGAYHANPALNLHDLAFLRALHTAIGAPEAGTPEQAAQWALGRALGRRLTRRADPAGDEQTLRLDRALAERLVRLCAKDAEATDAAFFETPRLGPALAGELDRAPDRVPAPDPEALLSPDARAVVTLWARMLSDGLARPEGAHALMRLIGE